ncbi:MAG TPA: LamG domain-containing protein [Candidatus Binatia bacterium]|nr:LamG domain-containing protein [Candidatus Binatia bacterium]
MDRVAAGVPRAADAARIGNVLPIPGSGTSHAALFDGAGSFVSIPEVRLAGAFTIEAWADLCGLISNEDAIVGHGRGTPNVNFFEQHLRLFVGDPGDLVVAGTAARPGVWEHWAIERDADGTRIYRNGVLDAEGATWTDPLVIDEIGRGDVGVLHGMLDEVAVYDVALTAEQLGTHVAAAGN